VFQDGIEKAIVGEAPKVGWLRRREQRQIWAQLLVPEPTPQASPQSPICFGSFVPGRGETVWNPATKDENRSSARPSLFPFPLLPSPRERTVNRAPPLISPSCSPYTRSGTFNFAFAILFNFPSQYFSAIGLCVIFRFWTNIRPTLRSIPKLRYSKWKTDLDTAPSSTGLSPSLVRSFILIRGRRRTTCLPLKGESETSITTRHPALWPFAFFVRHYWRHLIWFLFLRLIICLNSPGNEKREERKNSVFSFLNFVYCWVPIKKEWSSFLKGLKKWELGFSFFLF